MPVTTSRREEKIGLLAGAGRFPITFTAKARSLGLPVVCGGVSVSSGDIVIGDPDGVVIVPRSEIRAVLAQLPAVRANEAKMLKAVQGGLREPGFITPILASDRVRYVDD